VSSLTSVWRNKEAAKQLISFRGLELGTKTPTDIDMFYDIGGRFFIIGETKYMSADIPWGQQLAIERLCDGLERVGPTIAFITSHKTPYTDEIIMADTTVDSYRRRCEWKKGTGCCLKDGIKVFLDKR